MSKKSMISLIEAWEDQKDQYSTMRDFVEAFYQETKKTSSKKTETESRDAEGSEGSNEAESKTSRIKVMIKAPKEKKTRREKIVTEMGVETEKKPRALSKYQEFLKEWRVQHPEVKGKEAIKQGAAAWQDHKTTISVVGDGSEN
jgi:hypothetical protein